MKCKICNKNNLPFNRNFECSECTAKILAAFHYFSCPISEILNQIENQHTNQMSHLTHLKTTIKNPQVLQLVLEQMIDSGLNGILSGAYLETNSAIHDPFGNSKIADFVIRRKQSYQGGYDFGFKLMETGEFEFLTRDGSKQDAQKFYSQLLPWYARENALAALVQQGFQIESLTNDNGTTKIIAGKWL